MAPEKRDEDDEEFWGGYHALASREVDRIRGLVETMQRLGRGGAASAPRETVDINAIVGEVVRLLHREAELGRVDLSFESDPEAPKIVAIRDQIHQVVLNLVLNAIAATPQDGEVRLRVASERDGVRLEVKDTGAGIAESHVDQIFDPFFTTKGPDEGSGLGLMVCHRIVTDHEGSIEVRSRAGEGATFSIWLPAEAHGAIETVA